MRPCFRTLCTVFALLGMAALAGCAAMPPADDPEAVREFNEANDPLEPANRVFYAVNEALDTVILRPIALGYRYGVPQPVRTGVHNVLTNLGTPVTLANDMMQGKPRLAGDALMRLVLNTTVGAAGIFDVATGLGWPEHGNDFGITLAIWGLPDGMYLFVPVLGPSGPRDAIGFGVDTVVLDPFGHVGKGSTVLALRWGRLGIGAVDARAVVLDDLDRALAGALDPYATVRSLAQQYRRQQIEDLRRDAPASRPWPTDAAK